MERVKVSRKRVKQLLIDAGMTQKEICRRIPISWEHFCRCLNDGSLTRKVADKVCAILDCSVDDLGRYSAVKGMTSCRPPESEIPNEKSNESEISLKTCNLATNLQPTCNQLATDTISRSAALDVIRNIRAIAGSYDSEMLLIDKAEAQTELMMLPSVQPEDCDTCKHGYFGDGKCDNCRVRFPSHYERRADE